MHSSECCLYFLLTNLSSYRLARLGSTDSTPTNSTVSFTANASRSSYIWNQHDIGQPVCKFTQMHQANFNIHFQNGYQVILIFNLFTLIQNVSTFFITIKIDQTARHVCEKLNSHRKNKDLRSNRKHLYKLMWIDQCIKSEVYGVKHSRVTGSQHAGNHLTIAKQYVPGPSILRLWGRYRAPFPIATRGPGALYRAQEYHCNLVMFFF